jgi:protein-S-isoprenylcysteine O-methyltransferase Ste14
MSEASTETRPTDGEPAAPRSLGSVLFDNRRWVHPVSLLVAIVLGGAQPVGIAGGAACMAVMLSIRLATCRHFGGAAHVHARKAQVKRVLMTEGPFACVRNPLYLANSAGLAGACLLFVACVASLLWYGAVIRWEEGVLTRLYGQDYVDYLARVPRLLPRPPGRASATAREDLYPWPKALRRERGAIFAAVLLVGAGVLVRVVLD